MMRAALIERYGEPPVVREVEEPEADGGSLIEVSAAPMNPVDISMASGRFYATAPPTPYVPGGEGIGRPLQSGNPGPRVYFRAALPHGAMAERSVSNGQMTPVPDAVDDGVASALGTPGVAAYLALTRRAQLQKGENVLILGASGVVGVIAIQLARLLGAGRVIAGARNEEGLERARRLGADATVDLKQIEGLPERIREASGGLLQVVLDPVWGTPGAVALEALSRYGRSVHMGQAAGPEATLKSNTLRGGFLSILGYSTFLVPWEEQEAAYRALLDHAAAGQIEVDYEILPLEAAPEAWRRQAGSPHRKLVLSPRQTLEEPRSTFS